MIAVAQMEAAPVPNTGIALTDSDLDTFYTNRATLTNNMASANLLSFDNVALTTTVTSITGR